MATVSYAKFGAAFVAAAVTSVRIVDAVRQIAGDVVELGPLRTGPGDAAVVEAHGTIGEPVAEQVTGPLLRYSVRVPAELTLDVRLGGNHHFDVSAYIDLDLVVQTLDPLGINIEVAVVTPADVHTRIQAQGMQAKLLQRAAGIEAELAHHTAAYVNDRVATPEARRLTRIDLAPLIDKVWGAR